MRQWVSAGAAAVCLGFTLGCSQHLNRLEARHLIDEALKARPAGPAHVLATGYLPGFRVENSGVYSVDNFQLGTIPAISDSDPTAPLYQALAATGYLTITPAGSDGVDGPAYEQVAIGPKAGARHVEGSTQVYEAGFRCFQTLSGDTECQVPPLLEPEPRGYHIANIQQEGDRTRVLVSIPWRLTPLGQDLRAWVLQRLADPYEPYWENAVRYHDVSGQTQATVWFERFPTGWQIVDENGMTEKQYERMLATR